MEQNKLDVIAEYKHLYGQLNKETRTHSLSVGYLCEACAPLADLNKEKAFKLGLLHDIGKIYIPSRILKKNIKLNDVERQIVDLHSYFGYEILKNAGEGTDIYMPILFHHGFHKPKLSEPEEQITERMVRYTILLHAADIYDAMSRKRIYHSPFKKAEIIKELENDSMCTPWVIKIIKEAIEKKFVQKNIEEIEETVLSLTGKGVHYEKSIINC